MSLAAAGIAPHGFPIIPVLSKSAGGALRTREAMVRFGRAFRDAGVDAAVVAGPHGIRVDGAFAVVDAARVAGQLHWNGRTVDVNAPCDRPLIETIARAAEVDGLPVARVSYAGNRPSQAVAPLDWGALTPLWFLGHDQNVAHSGDVLATPPPDNGAPSVVLLTPSRSLGLEAMVAFGRSLGRAIAADPRRIGFVASCDWAHTHRDDGPYGFHDAAARVDAVVVDAVRRGQPIDLLALEQQEIEDAAIDGLWQVLMLACIQESVPMTWDLISYEAPTYYGMLVATAMPTVEPDGR